MAGAISVSRNSVIGRRNFSVLTAVYPQSNLSRLYMQTDINPYFDLSSCSHGVKIEVKQVNDNNTWICNKILVELSNFCNYG